MENSSRSSNDSRHFNLDRGRNNESVKERVKEERDIGIRGREREVRVGVLSRGTGERDGDKESRR